VISLEQRIIACVLATLVAAIIVPPVAHLNPVVGIGIFAAALALQLPLARVVPASVSDARRRRPLVCIAWMLLALLAIAQTGRLSMFMTDVTRTWGSTVPDAVAVNHQCLGAYIRAADLAQQGVQNLYAAERYPAYAGACGVPSKTVGVRGLGRWVVDPYLYPPQFLILPRLALLVTDSFDAIRTTWFVCQSLLFLAAAIALTRWLGGSAGLVWLLLVPALLASPPTMLNLQFGQFHVVAMLLASAAMVLFDVGWSATGGALLAFAILSKISPGILLITLAVQRRWRDLAWTFAAITGWTIVGMLVLGVAPFSAFLTYELPRLISGAAFSFVDLPSQSTFVMSRNFSITGIGVRLRLLGLPGLTHAQLTALAWLFTLVVIWLATRVRSDGTRLARLIGYLALLNLAALRAPAAPSAYVVVPALWMLALLASDGRGRRWWPWGIAVAWVIIVGPPPLPDRIDLIVSGIGQVAMVMICVWALVRRSPASFVHAEPTAALSPQWQRTVS
jgi:Glycosyltransferase family 87